MRCWVWWLSWGWCIAAGMRCCWAHSSPWRPLVLELSTSINKSSNLSRPTTALKAKVPHSSTHFTLVTFLYSKIKGNNDASHVTCDCHFTCKLFIGTKNIGCGTANCRNSHVMHISAVSYLDTMQCRIDTWVQSHRRLMMHSVILVHQWPRLGNSLSQS